MKRLTILTILFALFCFNAFSQDKQLLYIEITPYDATLEINGEVKPTKQGVYQEIVPLGNYTYKAYKEGYSAITGSIDISDPKKECILELKLKKKSIYSGTEQTHVHVIVSGEEIYIDNEYKGKYIWEGNLQIGRTYVMESKKAGYTSSPIKYTLISHGDSVEYIDLPDPTVIIDSEDDEDFEITIMDYQEEVVEEEVEEEAIPFQLVEEKPSFQGGDANHFSIWVNQNLVYPEIAKENGVQGRVTLQFIIEKDGRITNVKVLRGVHPVLDKEAVRVISSSPKWTPGKQRDRAVPVTYTFPVIFQLR